MPYSLRSPILLFSIFFSPNTKSECPDLKKHLTLSKVLLMPTGFQMQPSPTLKETFNLNVPVSFILEVICTADEAYGSSLCYLLISLIHCFQISDAISFCFQPKLFHNLIFLVICFFISLQLFRGGGTMTTSS